MAHVAALMHQQMRMGRRAMPCALRESYVDLVCFKLKKKHSCTLWPKHGPVNTASKKQQNRDSFALNMLFYVRWNMIFAFWASPRWVLGAQKISNRHPAERQFNELNNCDGQDSDRITIDSMSFMSFAWYLFGAYACHPFESNGVEWMHKTTYLANWRADTVSAQRNTI